MWRRNSSQQKHLGSLKMSWNEFYPQSRGWREAPPCLPPQIKFSEFSRRPLTTAGFLLSGWLVGILLTFGLLTCDSVFSLQLLLHECCFRGNVWNGFCRSELRCCFSTESAEQMCCCVSVWAQVWVFSQLINSFLSFYLQCYCFSKKWRKKCFSDFMTFSFIDTNQTSSGLKRTFTYCKNKLLLI